MCVCVCVCVHVLGPHPYEFPFLESSIRRMCVLLEVVIILCILEMVL